MQTLMNLHKWKRTYIHKHTHLHTCKHTYMRLEIVEGLTIPGAEGVQPLWQVTSPRPRKPGTAGLSPAKPQGGYTLSSWHPLACTAPTEASPANSAPSIAVLSFVKMKTRNTTIAMYVILMEGQRWQRPIATSAKTLLRLWMF